MKISLRSTSCLVGLLLASLSSYAQNDGSAAKGGPIVVLMTIDGFPARASGNHIRAGINLGTIPNLRVAPTIAKLLGVSLPAAKEQPLDAALE